VASQVSWQEAHQLEEQSVSRTPIQSPYKCINAPVEAVADGRAGAHELEQQQQGLGGHAKGPSVDQAEQGICGVVVERGVCEQISSSSSPEAAAALKLRCKRAGVHEAHTKLLVKHQPIAPLGSEHPPACASISGSTSSAGKCASINWYTTTKRLKAF